MRRHDRLLRVPMEWRAARLYLLFTPGLCVGDPWQTLTAALRGGVRLVQWRVKVPDPAGLTRCIQMCGDREVPVPVVVNDHVQMAVDHRACGAHVGQQDMAASEARRILGGSRCLGVSTHDMTEVQAALSAGADYLGFGPCFPTTTKGYRQGQPAGALARVVDHSPVPVFAIGGIAPDNIDQVLAEGCRQVAVSGAILAAEDPRAVAAQLCLKLGSAPEAS
ncbi:MAG: thiamine phosphate synthase [Planctomycetota bacterium]